MPAKKSTVATVPSLSLAFAVMVIVAGPMNVAPFAGLVNATLGGTFGGFTVTDTTAEDPVAPRLSVATALRL